MNYLLMLLLYTSSIDRQDTSKCERYLYSYDRPANAYLLTNNKYRGKSAPGGSHPLYYESFKNIGFWASEEELIKAKAKASCQKGYTY